MSWVKKGAEPNPKVVELVSSINIGDKLIFRQPYSTVENVKVYRPEGTFGGGKTDEYGDVEVEIPSGEIGIVSDIMGDEEIVVDVEVTVEFEGEDGKIVTDWKGSVQMVGDQILILERV